LNEILFASTSPDLTALFQKVKEEMGINCSVLEVNATSDMETEPVLSIDDSVKVLVSRGGAVGYLRERFKVSVIEVNIGFSDIMRSITEAASLGGRKIAYLSSTLNQKQNDIFANIGGIDLTIRSFSAYSTYRELRDMGNEIIAFAKRGEIDAVIWDAVSIPGLKELGIIEVVLKSNEDAVRQALLEAAKILNSLKVEQSRRKELETAINQLDRCILILDKNKVIKSCNQAAQRVFSKNLEQLVGENIDKLLPLATLDAILDGEPSEKGELVEYHGVKLIVSNNPIVVGAAIESIIVTVDRVNDIFAQELSIRTDLYKKYEKNGLVASYTFKDIEGKSSKLQNAITQASRYAKSNEIILIIGETGTGKELFAQSIHNASNYSKGPFVSLNCASLSDNLLESELFGYEEGTFTGALKGGKKGLFEIAHRGTIFLDEIATTSTGFQARLLRVLQERRIRRLGGGSNIPIDVRVICSTNKNLKNEARSGNFLGDLLYRISVLIVEIPPLRERKTDVRELARYFINLESNAQNLTVRWKDDSIFQPLINYDWPGNVRQLKNVVKRAVISVGGGELTQEAIQESLRWEQIPENDQAIMIQVSSSRKDMERQMYEQLFKLCENDRHKFCRDFNISKTTLWRKLNLG
jgi:transcriptional regulator with PAS, ATPase and Fis domain